MSQYLSPLLKLLADGKFHSGDELGQSLGVSRATVWKTSKKISALGLGVHSVRGKGYRLTRSLDLLDSEAILAGLNRVTTKKIAEFEVLSVVDSSNSHVLRKIQNTCPDLNGGRVLICLAEQQTAGRGRRGRVWLSPFGNNMYLSVVREFESGAVGLEGLSLVVGLALLRALTMIGVKGLGLKWPNDVLWQNKKVAGILLEMSGDVSGACQVVIGIGLNIRNESSDMTEVDQPWADLHSISPNLPGRNQLIAGVINELISALDDFEQGGFKSIMNEWAEFDILNGQEVELRRSLAENSDNGIMGIARGVNPGGALLIETEDGVLTFHGGEVSVRTVGQDASVK